MGISKPKGNQELPVLEAIPNKVFEFVFSLVIKELTPKPFFYTSFPSLIIPIANPGTLNNRRSFVARLSI
ncbi:MULTISPECIES: hypothetical protein [unclassified Mucilaginibacter]|uniref:hypothetical protein n=1 Tax=unclassified Mucilaginibacter TaxID=2617802 RepID=UPI002AC8FCEC|nr:MULTISPECIES: hypothetical protein [unclassified Mucilaginibacter]MEB0262678.1 hypothetical protein [Mucilaginibacter sp. 10I4]MEB0279899.1 hypothetical protein [Mucilaginibacter sp. 10B2]MEB0300045.1 hypothetical protein [Mucilaginibacter sp. 5C4]WPX21858.1 hypothetical protein RHM67_11235 [Mucilaginibacter sp. 5C4]